jgi:hypothetical protein
MLSVFANSDEKLMHWHATAQFFGTGWSDVQSPDWSSGPPHRWSVETQNPTIVLPVKKDGKYIMTFHVQRFVREEQRAGFSLLLNGNKMPLIGPVPAEKSGVGGGIFAADLGRQSLEGCVLTFHVDLLKSFNDANPQDPDKTPRGLAISSITLVMLDG